MSFRALFIPLVLMGLVGCTNPFDGGSSTVDQGYQSGAPPSLTALPTTANFDQNTTSSPITLPYTGVGGVQPVSCEINALTNLTVATVCECQNSVCQVSVTAAHNFNGAGSFGFRLIDDQGRPSNWASVAVTVNHVNQPPTIGPLANATILADVASAVIAVPVTDIDSTINCATGLSVVSADPTLLPVAGIQFSGSPPSCAMVITPGVGQTGSTTLDLTVTDGALTATASMTVTVNVNPPGAPTLLTATYAAGPSVQLNWNASTGPGPIQYTVYRSALSGSGYAPVTGCTGLSVLTCSDSSFVNGTDYYYIVRATNLTGTSAASNEATINPTLPTAATLSKTSIANGVSLAWTGSTGTAPLTYQVRRGISPGGPYSDLATGLTGATYTDSTAVAGTTYYYVVATVNAGGSIQSNEVAATSMVPFNLTSVSVSGAGAVSLTWPAVAGASTYRVKYGTVSGSYPTLVTATGSSPQSISGLTAGTTYYFQVIAENATDTLPASNELSAVPLGAFSISSATASSGQIVLAWGPSAGATTYTVKYGTSSGSYPTTFSTTATSPTTITPLANGSTYYLMVTAVNASGTLDASAEASALPIDVPAAPATISAQATPGQVALTWGASTGPGTITYDVRRGTASGTYTTIAASLSATTYTDTSVTDGTTYYYVVRPRNEGGTGPVSSESSVRPIGTFGITSTIAGSGHVELQWGAATGASTYTVWRSTSANPEVTGAPLVACTALTTLVCDDTSVVNGTPYYYVVIASNTVGTLSTSQSISNEVSATPLASPWTSVTAKTGQVDFVWLTNLLTPTPLSYTIKYSTVANDAANGANLTGCTAVAHPTASCSGTGLTNGTTYYFVIVADQGGGVTYVSDEVSARPIGALTVNSAVANSSTQVTVSWNDVIGETGYTVNYGTSTGSYASNGGSAAQNATSRVVTGLSGGTTYYFRVRASNSSGFVDGTPEVSVTTPVFPSVPAGLAVAISQAARLDLSWTASTGTGPLTYEVLRSTSSGSGYSSLASGISGTSYQDTAANPGTTYYYVVRSTGPGGTSTYSSEVTGVALAAFTLSGISASDDSTASLSWNASTGATAYTVKYGTSSGTYGTTVSTSASSPQSITGLTGGATYYAMVTATNATGSVDATTEVNITMPVRPAAPVPAIAITQASRLDLSWAAVTGTAPVTYTVERSTTSGAGFAALASCTAISGSSCNDASVTAGTLYYYRVVASGPGGSQTSAEVSGRALGAFSISGTAATSDTTATITWGASAGAVSYTLAYGTSSGTYGTVVTTTATSPQAVAGLSSGTTYYFMVTAVNATGQIRAVSETSLTTPIRPAAPVLTKTSVNAGVSLSWNQPSGTLPMAYDVKRSTVSGSGYTTLSTAQSLTTYSDPTAAYGTTYYYLVTATNPGGSTDSNEVSATPIATFNQTSAVVVATTSARVTWPAVSGASAYTLAYGTSSGGPYGTTVSTSATSPANVTGLTGATTYYFKVTATNATDSQASTNETSVTAIGNFAVTSIVGGHQSLTLAWSAAAGATSYDVEYGTSAGTYSTTLTNQSSPVTIAGLTNGTTYYVRVVAKNSSGSAPSAEVSRAPGLSLAKNAGDAQTAVVDTTLPTAIRVRVTDAASSPVAGIAVAWSVTSGGGSLASCDAVTDASGYAQCDWRLGTTVGANTVQAAILSGTQTVSFTATGTNSPATSLVLSGIPASVTAGSTHSLVVKAVDSFGNTAVDYTGTVAFTSTDGAAVLPVNTAFTGPDAGQKTFAGVSLRTSGTQSVTAADTVTGTITGTHANVTVGAAAADHLVLVAGDAQSATVGQSLAVNPRVRVVDTYGNAVAGTTVTFTPSAGSVGSTTAVTDASGEAATTMTLGTTAGAQTLTVARQTTALPGAPATLTFNFTAVAGPAAAITFATPPSASTVSLVAFATQPVLDIVDGYGNRILSGPDATANVTITLQTGTGTLGGTATKAAVAGRADFAGLGLNIDLIGTNKVLRATKADTSGGGGTAAVHVDSSALTITHAAATQLAFGTEPGGGVAGSAWATQPALRILDASGNLVTTGAAATANVTVAIANNAGAGTLSGTTTVAAAAGVASFTGLSINKVGTGYTLGATSAGLTSATSAGFAITVGAPSKLVFQTQPGNGVAGSALSTQPVVYVVDTNDNLITTSTASVTLSLASNPGSATLSGTATVAAVGGVATFTGLSLQKTGVGYTFSAASAGLTSATSSTFDITPGAATKLAYGTQPGNGVAGTALTTQPVVRVLDANDNLVTGSSASITLAIGTNPGSGTLSGTATVAAASGVATFAGLSIDKTGTGYTLSATSAGLTGATSSTFNITPGSATKLAYGTQPGNGVAGSALTTQPIVRVLDANDNLVTGSSASITLAIGTNPGSGALSGTATVAAVSGVATFTGLSINKTGTGYTLSASSAGLTSATSSTFNITPGTATKLAFGTQPGNGVAGSALSTQPIVQVLDANDNVVTSATDTVTLAIITNPGSGTLSGTASLAATSGVATFAGLSIEKTGTGYQLRATAAGLTAVTSSAFNITPGAATKLAVQTEPGNGVAGSALSTQPVVRILDANDNLVTSATTTVTAAITTNPGTGSLSGTAGVAAVGGVVTFAGLSIDKVGTGYRLGFTAAGLASATSSTFNITPGAAAKLAFNTQPGSGVAGSALVTQPVAHILDANDNLVTSSTATVTLAIGTNPGGGTLSGTAAVAAVGGVATFSGLSIEKTGTGYTLAATSPGLTGATSSNFNITPGAATKLAFGTQPGNGVAGSALSTQPVVRVLDANDNIVTGSSASITLAIGTNPGSGTLSGTATVAASSGVATFTGLSIEKTGTGYTLAATSAGLTSATSSTFNITHGAATKLSFNTQPGNGVAGTALSTQPVLRVLDANDNLVTGSSASITLAIGTNPGSGALSGTATVAASSGVATFAGLSINKTGTGYTLTATSAGLTSATSSTFNITPGTATKLAFGTQPGNGVAGSALSTQPVVRVLDANDNIVTGSSASITLAIGTNPGGGTLSGTATVAASSGVATFSGLSIEKTGTGYTLAATSAGLTGATSSTFNITPGAATQLTFATSPGGGVAGAAWSTQPVVRVLDANANIVTGSSASITLTIANNPGSGTLSGTATLAATAGVATFAGLSLDKVGTGYTLSAAAAGLTGATSSGFNITHAPASQMVFTTQPGGATAGVVFTQQPVVEIRDAYGNRVITGADAGAILTMSLTTGTGTLTTTTAQTAVLGIAIWTDLKIDAFGSKVITATKPDLSGSGGAGVLTVASNSFTNATNPPAVPTGLAANTGDAAVAMSWTAVSGATSYNIMRGTVSGTLTQIATSATNTYTDTTPSNGTTYYYAVQAVNAGGTSASSSEISARPVATSTISSVVVSAAGTLTLTWSAGAGAANYQVKYATTSGGASTGTNGCATTAPTVTCAVSGLTAGTTYYFSVVSTNAVGGGASTASAAAAGVPLATPSLSLAAASRQLTPTFSAAGATSYNLSYGTSSGSYGTTVNGATSGAAVTGLINGTTYYFRVTAVNAYGTLNSSEQSSSPNGPHAFSLSAGTPGNAQVALTWGASTAATSYTVKYGTSSGSYGTTFATGVVGTSSTVTGLTNGTTYYFMVTAVNANGTQDSTVEWTATPAQPTLSGTQNLTSPTMGSAFTARVPFTLGGLSSLTCVGNVGATSSNSSVFATGAISISGTYPNCWMSASVSGNVTGTTTVTLTATYGSATATAAYDITFVTGVAAAYSVRRLVLGYNSALMRVRHGTNNAEADVAIDNSNTISANSVVTITAAGTSGWTIGQTMAFSTFYSGASIYVTTWYDQSGNARDVANATTGTQPRLVNAGALETLNTRPAVNYTAMGQTLNSSARVVSSVNEYATMYVGTSGANNATPFSLNGSDSGQRLTMHVPENTNVMSDLASGATAYNRQTGSWTGYSLNTGMIVAQVNSTSSNVRRVRINGTNLASTTATNYATTITQGTLQLGATLYGASYGFSGKFSEFVVMTSNAVATNTSLETGGKAYFGTP